MLLTDVFDMSLVGSAGVPALDVDAPDGTVRTLTFGDLDERASRMAHALRARGVAPGDRVAVHLANRVEFIDLFLACLRLGALFVPVNVLYRTREIAHIMADADPRVVVAAASTAGLFPAESPVIDVEALTSDASQAPSDRVTRSGHGEDPAVIIYTSGTTGRAKGAVLSHNNFLSNVANIVTCWQITHGDRYLAVLPLFHVHGLANGVCAWLASGCRMRLVERFDRDRARSLFDEFQPTLFFGVPTIYVRLLEIDEQDARRFGGRARLFVSGSAPLPAQVFEAFRERYGHAILERYGMSEALMLVSNPYAGERRPGTVGTPLPGVVARLVDSSGHDVVGAEPGEVVVRGPNVFSGYWRNPAATAAAFSNGWFRTGDLAQRSADGYFTLRGRATDLIITNGFNVYPREIEELLLEVPGIREVAVVGAPDAIRGEVPVAYLVASDDFRSDVARETCSRGLASFKIPRAFVRLDALPRNALGKVQKHLLPPHPVS